MNKKGLSHVEFIISLVIFMTFVLFLLTFFNPLKKSTDNTAVLDVLEKQIVSYSEIDVLTGSMVVENTGGDCFSVESLSNKKVIVRKDGRIQGENKGDVTDIENNGSGIYNLFYSDSFEELPVSGSCQELNKSKYSFGLTRENEIVSLEKLKVLADAYNNRYTDAKDKINISENKDFGFIVYDLNGTEIMKAFKQKTSADVNAREINLETIDKDANIKSVILNLRIW